MSTNQPTISLRGLTKMYGKARGILDVSFDVGEGELFGFIGPNGAGKSTTIRTLLGLIHPTAGSATVFGKDIVTHGTEIRREIGYLPSEVFYYEDMRVMDLLQYSAKFYGKRCDTRMQALCNTLELDPKRKITDLSFGNRKKVGIVQGLLHEPKLIILDEPTSGLDPLMQHAFFDLIAQENRRGATVLFSSHILSEVQRLCHRVAIIKEGRVIRLETMEQLRRSNTKRVRVELATEGDLQRMTTDLNQRMGSDISGHEGEGGTLSFLLRGDLNPLLGLLSAYNIANLEITEPDLEEIFLHYYEKEQSL